MMILFVVLRGATRNALYIRHGCLLYVLHSFGTTTPFFVIKVLLFII